MKTTLGGDRLGSGNKQEISMRNYERSTHDLSYIWRSTMASGTLVPFLTEVGLPGDTFDIDLSAHGMTHPTVGPLFGSYKMQLDVFSIPIRIYNAKLHMNQLGLGLKMSEVKLPQILIKADGNKKYNTGDNEQINPSCILSYLNIRGLGLGNDETEEYVEVERKFNAVPFLAYWDIYKNYYANKQEEIGYVIHNPMVAGDNNIESIRIITTGQNKELSETVPITINTGTWCAMTARMETNDRPVFSEIFLRIGITPWRITEIWENVIWDESTKTVSGGIIKDAFKNQSEGWIFDSYNGATVQSLLEPPKLEKFQLKNIDDMRLNILGNIEGYAFTITDDLTPPYSLVLKKGTSAPSERQQAWSKLSSQEGLAIKTYQSDLFNNWISTEWIDGTNGINEITSIDTSGGSFSIDALNLASKVYNMLNRIGMSGGTYDDWLDAVYTHERVRSTESPMYMGSLIKEISFEEVISTASTETESTAEPLGTLAGRGVMTNKHKGGKIRIKVDEPSYIMGIVSLTPRIDYSQGNKWDVNLKTLDDLHKPALDAIGFQDLITDQMAWQDTTITAGEPKYKSAGKQPAWINYMTNVNQVRGNFAEKNNQMWMTLNRRYQTGENGIEDLTTYIDPTKFNQIFADTALDAQNFWIQIGIDMIARRKMSAKVIPNL